MSSLQSAIMIIMAEISFILAVIMGYLGFRYLRTNRDIMSAIGRLADKIRGKKDDRLAMLHDFLVKTCHYDEEKATSTATELIEKERLFYNSLMETYLHRDNNALMNLDNKTEEIISAYRNLLSASEKAITEESQQELEIRIQQLSSTINELNDKNEQLTDEVKHLKNEMDVTVEEYSSAFRNKQAHDSSQTGASDDGSSADNKPDDFVEPDFQNHGINDSAAKATSPDPGNSDAADAGLTVDDEIIDDLEALAAQGAVALAFVDRRLDIETDIRQDRKSVV